MPTHRALSLYLLHEVTKKHGNFGKNIFSDNRTRLSGILTGLSAAFGDPSSDKMFPQSYFKPRPSHQTFSNTIDRHNLSPKEMRIIFCTHHHFLNANPSKTIGKLGSCSKSKHLRLNLPTCIKNIKVPTGKLELS